MHACTCISVLQVTLQFKLENIISWIKTPVIYFTIYKKCFTSLFFPFVELDSAMALAPIYSRHISFDSDYTHK